MHFSASIVIRMIGNLADIISGFRVVIERLLKTSPTGAIFSLYILKPTFVSTTTVVTMKAPTILLYYFLFQIGPATIQSPQYLGPYKEIYPYTDITQDQQSCVPNPAANHTCPLYIALMLSFGGDFVSSGVIPGVQLALNQINSDPSMLPGYSLHYTLTDTQV